MTISIDMPLPLALRIRRLAADLMAAVCGEQERQQSLDRTFNELFRRHNNLIAGICLSFARTREEFEDLRQDSLLNLWNGLGRFRSECSTSTWVYRVVLNTCVSYGRRRYVSRRDEEAYREFYIELFDETSAEELERYEQMYRLISMLPPMDRGVLLMWLDDKKYEEIAVVMGLSRDAVASRLKRARDRLAAMASAQR